MAPGQRRFELTPVHKLGKDKGSLVNAINRCVGVSACRSETGVRPGVGTPVKKACVELSRQVP